MVVWTPKMADIYIFTAQRPRPLIVSCFSVGPRLYFAAAKASTLYILVTMARMWSQYLSTAPRLCARDAEVQARLAEALTSSLYLSILSIIICSCTERLLKKRLRDSVDEVQRYSTKQDIFECALD